MLICKFEAGTENFCIKQKEVVSMKAFNRNKSRVCINTAFDWWYLIILSKTKVSGQYWSRVGTKSDFWVWKTLTIHNQRYKSKLFGNNYKMTDYDNTRNTIFTILKATLMKGACKGAQLWHRIQHLQPLPYQFWLLEIQYNI